ncbi:MAG: nuclear transport factor 2 family protein [Planctomycetota bacterium]
MGPLTMVTERARARAAWALVLLAPFTVACRDLASNRSVAPPGNQARPGLRPEDPKGSANVATGVPIPERHTQVAKPTPAVPDDTIVPPQPPGPSLQALRREANRVVDDWHAAAAVGDAARYIGHMADDAVFMGTDASERWDLAAFRIYVDQYMQPGKGWVYVPTERVVVIPEDSEIAWFDERLANDGYGELRGTGSCAATRTRGASCTTA